MRAIGPILNVVMKAQVALPFRWLCHTFAPACPAIQGGEVRGSPQAAVSGLFTEQPAGMWRWDEDHAEIRRRRPGGEPGQDAVPVPIGTVRPGGRELDNRICLSGSLIRAA